MMRNKKIWGSMIAGLVLGCLGSGFRLIKPKKGKKLKLGIQAPDFQAYDETGNLHQLSDYVGKKKLILYFYPKDNSPFCTQQAKNLRDQYKQLAQAGYAILGVSMDTPKSHQAFREKHQLPFHLLSDPKSTLHRAYGARMSQGLFRWFTKRITFVIDQQGTITQIIDQVKVKNHAQQILDQEAQQVTKKTN